MAPSLYSEKIIMIKNYQLGLYEKVTPQDLSWEERLEVAAKNGFDYMEISVDESDARQARLDWTAAERQAVIDATKNTGIPLAPCVSPATASGPLVPRTLRSAPTPLR